MGSDPQEWRPQHRSALCREDCEGIQRTCGGARQHSGLFEEPEGEVCGDSSGIEEIEAIRFRVVESDIPTKITLNKSSLNLYVNKSETLSVQFTPASTSDKLTWTTSNKEVAEVDSNGKVTGKSEGTATITVKTSNGLTASL